MADELGEIRSRISIVELAEASGIRLKKSGKSFLGLCPFHPDKSPSLHINPEFGTYRCFACGAKGSIFDWVMNTQHLDFKEALKFLADKAGVKLSGSHAASAEEKTLRKKYQEAMEASAVLYQKELEKSVSALKYCEDRRLDHALIEKWRIGYSPAIGEALAANLQRNGYTLKFSSEIGLVEGDDQTGYRDRFRDRLMFPIRSELGHVIAFGGRIIGEGTPKYINSSDTPLFSKGKTLYGLFESLNTLKTLRKAILVEGYLDVIACHTAGAKTAMASLGTSLTEDQARLIKRWADHVTVAYDGDSAGIKAAQKAASILREAGLEVSVCLFPEGNDPFSMLHAEGAKSVLDVLASSQTPLSFAMDRLFESMQPEDPVLWRQTVEILAEWNQDLEIMSEIDRIAPRYPGVQDVAAARRALRGLVSKARKKPTSRGSTVPDGQVFAGNEPSTNPEAPHLHIAEQGLIHAYLEGTWRMHLHRELDTALLMSPAALQFFSQVKSTFLNEPPAGPPAEWIHELGIAFEWLAWANYERFGTPTEEFITDCWSTLEKLKRAREQTAEDQASDPLVAAMNRLKILKSVPKSEN